MEQYLQPCISVNIRDFPRNEPFEELTQFGQITIVDEIEDNVYVFWNATTECVVVEYMGELFTLTDSSEMTTMELLERFVDMGEVEIQGGSFCARVDGADWFEEIVGLGEPFMYRIRDAYALSVTMRGRFRDLNDA